MGGHKVVKVVIDKGRLINAMHDRSAENCCYNQARDRQDFAKEGLLSDCNSLGQIPSSLGFVVLPRMHVLLKPRLWFVSFHGSTYGFPMVVSHREGLADSCLLL